MRKHLLGAFLWENICMSHVVGDLQRTTYEENICEGTLKKRLWDAPI